MGRVDDELAVDAADAERAPIGPPKGMSETISAGGSAVDAEDVGIILAIGGEKRVVMICVLVEVALGEERAQRAVRQCGR